MNIHLRQIIGFIGLAVFGCGHYLLLGLFIHGAYNPFWVTRFHVPAWSANSQHICFTAEFSVANVDYTLDVERKILTIVHKDSVECSTHMLLTSPRFAENVMEKFGNIELHLVSPDRSKILLITYASDDADRILYVLDAPTGRVLSKIEERELFKARSVSIFGIQLGWQDCEYLCFLLLGIGTLAIFQFLMLLQNPLNKTFRVLLGLFILHGFCACSVWFIFPMSA